ncbi:protein-tyrosine phosphatase-like protein [Crassisporium funariophilum]|nr:protein-tyrosine phosphatase-like protein [Crassisporium funariophilum]
MTTHEKLAHLASQHHSSEYNRAKFGVHGCPIRYLPLSIHLPEHFHQLRSQQLISAQVQSWWPSQNSSSAIVSVNPASLQDEIMAAMSEPLNSALNIPDPLVKPSLKTSLTHPINISPIIPPELLALISSHAFLSSSKPSFTLLEIPEFFSLDRLLNSRDARLQNRLPNQLYIQPPPLPLLAKHTTVGHFRTRSNITDALQAAIGSGIERASADKFTEGHHAPSEAALGDSIVNHFHAAVIPETSLSLALSMAGPTSVHSTSIGLSNIPTSTIHDIMSMKQSGSGNLRVVEQKPIPPLSLGPRIHSENKIISISTWISEPSRRDASSPASTSSLTIGNLFLSSCPGKKLRLDGPVKGRSGVRRDLQTDMKRMKDMGTGCIICCLDDSELEFLGAPWTEYESCANINGMDVLRLPIPEGLAPLTTTHLDAHLVDLINRYTLRGIPILVHCRGGVGRAGVVACCWLIRLGLCGWASRPHEALHPTMEDDFLRDCSILSFVERVINLVRKRRSIKAIETYEQVKFLLDYVTFLLEQAQTRNPPVTP